MNTIPSLRKLIQKPFQRELEDVLETTQPIESKLHVVMVTSNACLFRRRYQLAREFMQRMRRTPNIQLYIVELAYGTQPFALTDSKDPSHLQIRCDYPLWHKENMINLAVQKLLPQDWRAFAWIDADIRFENQSWALDTLKLLNGYKNVVQLFEYALQLGPKNNEINHFMSAGRNYVDKNEPQMWHPGYAWAMTRELYEQMGGLFEYAILGGADTLLCLGYGCSGKYTFSHRVCPEFTECIDDFISKVTDIRLGYVPGNIRHYYHGSFENRKYLERWNVLRDHGFNPYTHVCKNDDGVLVPTPECPRGLLADIMTYFEERNEDEGLFPDRPKSAYRAFLRHVECVDTEEEPEQYNDSQSQTEVSVPQCETKPDIESSVVPDSVEASADTPDSKNEHAIPEALESERDSVTEQTPSTA